MSSSSSLRAVVERKKQERERLLAGDTRPVAPPAPRASRFTQSRAPPPTRGGTSEQPDPAPSENRIVRLYRQYFGTRKDVSVTEVEDIPDTGATSMARGQAALFLAAIIFGFTLFYYIIFLKRSTIYPSGQEDGTPQYSYLHLGHVVDWFILILVGAFATIPEPVFFALLFEIIVLVADAIAATARGIYVFNTVGLSSATVADWINFALAIVFGFLALFAVITLLQLYIGLRKKVAQFYVSKSKDSEFFATQVYMQALTLLVQMGFDGTAIVKYAPELLAEPRRLWYLNAATGTHAMAGNFTKAEREDAMGMAVASGEYLEDPNMGSLVYFREMRDNGDRVMAQVRDAVRRTYPDKYDPQTGERLEPSDGTGVSLDQAHRDMERTGGRVESSAQQAVAATAAATASSGGRGVPVLPSASAPYFDALPSAKQHPHQHNLKKRSVNSNSSSSSSSNNNSDDGRNKSATGKAPSANRTQEDGASDALHPGSLTVEAMMAAEVEAMKNKQH